MPPRPPPLPSMITTSVSQAQGVQRRAAYGKTDPSAKRRSLSSYLAQRLTRLSGWGPSGTLVTRWGRWGRWRPTMPLMSAARVGTWRATWPVGGVGEACVRA
jgi:hypothetical protein